MSADDALTDRDAAALEAATTTDNGEDDRLEARRNTVTAGTHDVHEELAELRDLLADTRKQLAEERKARLELEAQIDDSPPANTQPVDGPDTIIESYVAMDDDERQDLIGPSDRRAAVLADHWWDLAKQAGNGNYVVTTHRNSTRKNNPSQVRIDLGKYCQEDLEWEQIYRAMKTLAKKSASDTDAVDVFTDEKGRTHIVGGAFQYHEKVTPDGSSTYKVVELVDPELVNTVVSEFP